METQYYSLRPAQQAYGSTILQMNILNKTQSERCKLKQPFFTWRDMRTSFDFRMMFEAPQRKVLVFQLFLRYRCILIQYMSCAIITISSTHSLWFICCHTRSYGFSIRQMQSMCKRSKSYEFQSNSIVWHCIWSDVMIYVSVIVWQSTPTHTQPTTPQGGAGREFHRYVALAAVGSTIPYPYHSPQTTGG